MRAAVARPGARRLAAVELTLLVGSYAIAAYLGADGRNMTEAVRAWRRFLPRFLPMPHASWRNTGWLKRNPWFADRLVPALRRRVQTIAENKTAA